MDVSLETVLYFILSSGQHLKLFYIGMLRICSLLKLNSKVRRQREWVYLTW